MSNINAGLIKVAYRGVAGFFVILFMFVLGVTGFALAFSGGLILEMFLKILVLELSIWVVN